MAPMSEFTKLPVSAIYFGGVAAHSGSSFQIRAARCHPSQTLMAPSAVAAVPRPKLLAP